MALSEYVAFYQQKIRNRIRMIVPPEIISCKQTGLPLSNICFEDTLKLLRKLGFTL